ncbi:hypothetical protein EV649_4999 [Kribbella sp. VKM Ac-2569]|uniref:hypothetical protein n=1 Tax=Kribbella sp. VKM Ac-2569 TaxID=2512220 RepID=UPI0010E8DE0D|nr:hypothetical protein [Kribbella sp. VKM Ac-2569]RZT17457.1 hypothetical protein EV649_4999 [Kribbella sp. VKM Ac-2569]
MMRNAIITSVALAVFVAATAVGGAVTGATAAVADSASHAQPVLTLPLPTGPYPVGVRTASVSDPTRIDDQTGRPRRLPIRVWYPAIQHGAVPPAPYVSAAVQPALEQVFGLPTGWLDVDTHAAPDVRPRQHVAGVVLVQHAGGFLAAFQTGQVIDLASRGYAVVTMEHPHESLVIEEPDGTLIFADDPETRPFNERIQDAAVVLGQLHRLVPEADRRTPVAMFGHSRGGAAAAEVMLHHPQVIAGVDLDGSPRGDVVAAGLDQPFGLMLSLDQPLQGNTLLAEFLGNLRGPHPVRELPVRHYGYSDWVVFNPQAARADPAVGAQLEQLVPTGTVDDLRAGRAALTAQRQFLSRFFAQHLNERVGHR